MTLAPNPSGLCFCGCGEDAPIATRTNRARGLVKGRPVRFILGHQNRTPEVRALRVEQFQNPEARARVAEQRTAHGRHGTPTYRSWRSMKTRCTNPNHEGYTYYGGRGIRVCDRWAESFETFLADMGDRPEGTSLDRIDPDGDYEPGNVRWATASEQRRNRRDYPAPSRTTPPLVEVPRPV
jgi:hypothetical protein